VLAVPKAWLREQLARDVGFAARFYRALAMFLAERIRRSIRRAWGSAMKRSAATTRPIWTRSIRG
jgi:hypothetical protein